ncbi:NUDIX hydrolase [Natronoglycomyces albus]|uniref:NUDIX hydrolase n=1 Tax=Natronoglycomyces albus TaxID=2811108 RepID=A0A895XV57_9ACTN|nr:NUDIX hydrolase [Natronoglycomyces albus]QSB05528.1 NUDIX hydrolase [Natronoglycomyces albus]
MREVSEGQLWDEGRFGRLEPVALTDGKPFTAGVILQRDDAVLTSLTARTSAAHEPEGEHWYVGGIGGGQEPGEDVWECAHREAREETGVPIQLTKADITYMNDVDAGESWMTWTAGISPLLIRRTRNTDSRTPIKPGLPSGRYTYHFTFLGQLADERPFAIAGEDITALAWVPLSQWDKLYDNPTMGQMRRGGMNIVAGDSIADSARLRVRQTEALRLVIALLA